MKILKIILLAIIFQFCFYCSTVKDSLHISPRVYVLCYHTFIGHTSYIDFSFEELDNQLNTFEQNGFHFITINDLLDNKVEFKKNILITFDDGHKSQYDAYFKILKKHNIQLVFFIIVGYIGSNNYLTKDQLIDLKIEGCSISNHSWSHPFLNKKYFIEKDSKSINRELIDSQLYLKNISESDSKIFAYPYGSYCDTTIEFLKDADFKCAFTIDEGYIKIPILEGDMFRLPRYMVTR